MQRLIYLSTAIPDVKAVYLHDGSVSDLKYMWLEKKESVCGVSFAGSAYRKVQENGPQKELGELSSEGALINAAGKEAIAKFKDVLLVGDDFDKEEIRNVIGNTQMQEVEQMGMIPGDVLWLTKKVQTHIHANKDVLDGLIDIVFDIPSVTDLFIGRKPIVGKSIDLLAAVVSDSKQASDVIYRESLQMLKDPTLLKGLYKAYLAFDKIVQERHNASWWSNLANGMIKAIENKSSIKMYVRGIEEPFTIPNLDDVWRNKALYFTETGLEIRGEIYSLHWHLSRKGVHLKNNSLPYAKIERLEYRKKSVWENPC